MDPSPEKCHHLYHLITFGCQMNQADAQRLRGLLAAIGYSETDREEDADLILLLTCMVREHAEQRLIGRVRAMSRIRRERPHLLIGIAGCVAQQYRDKLFDLLPHIDLIFGPNDLEELPVLLQRAANQKTAGMFLPQGTFSGDEADGIILQQPFSALVNIVRGCTNLCAYCIVPHVRGPEVSRPMDEILQFVANLVKQGVKEVTLLGQNVNSYGRDLGLADGFPRLLEALEQVDGLEWIRFITSHPKDFSLETIERMSHLSKLCEHVHLPVQAGSDRILALMNRGYTRTHFLKLIDGIRQNIPDVSLTTDIICGFPTETDDEFLQTIDLIEKVRFASAYMYYFSPRPGTPAAEMAGALPESERKERLARLIEIQNAIALDLSGQLIGKTFPVLVEKVSGRDPSNLVGRTRSGRVVDFPGSAEIIGTFAKVKIDRARHWTLSGHQVENAGKDDESARP